MKYSIYRWLIPILVSAWLLVGCGKPQADQSDGESAEEIAGEADAPVQAAQYEPDALANAKADLLARLIESERRLSNEQDSIEKAQSLSAAGERRIGAWIEELRNRTDSLYESARGLAIPGPSGDLEYFRSQVRSMEERRQSVEQELSVLSNLLAHRAEYEQSLVALFGEASPEPAFLRWDLPLQSDRARISLRSVADQAIENGDWPDAEQLLALGPGWLRRVQGYRKIQRERAHEQIARLVERAEQAIADDRLTTPAGENAAEWLQQARALDPEHPEVIRLYGEVVERYAALSRQALERGNYRAARSYVTRVRSLPISDASKNRFSETAQKAAELARRESVSGRMEAAVEAGRRGEIEALRVQLADLRERAPDDPRLDQIEARYRVMLHQPGRVFSEELGEDVSVDGLRMIVGPRGEFMVGSERPSFSLFRRSRKHEEPRHEINIQYPYAVSQTEITVDQFRAFVEATGYQTDAERAGFSEVFTSAGQTRVVNRTWRHDWLGRKAEGTHPAIHVSWNDAQAFADWLSRETRNRYRLPSEAEFEALARSMREGDFYWSEDSGPEPFSGNFLGGRDQPPPEWGGNDVISLDDELAAYEDGSFGPTSVARYPANDFGFNDLIGNVSEWTQDCAHEDHSDSPGDGRPRESSGDCQRRVVRGGSWISGYEAYRLSHRRLRSRGAHDSATGFRVAMDFKTERGDEL